VLDPVKGTALDIGVARDALAKLPIEEQRQAADEGSVQRPMSRA